MNVSIPYGKSKLTFDLSGEKLLSVLTPSHAPDKIEDPVKIVRCSLDHPIASRPLWELAEGKKNVVVIASDHTRPVPSKIIMPLLLEDIRRGNPDADITILIATGCHRGTTQAELIAKFGTDIVERERIVIHDCEDENNLVRIGILPSGGDLVVNRLAWEADLLVSEGFIEPHFFAGFSGGRKSVLPGIASRTCVHYNHNAAFIDDPCARMGILAHNPIHEDMLYAAKTAGLAFICNVVLNAQGQILGAFSGDTQTAHEEGAAFVTKLMKAEPAMADIVITSNNGYPLDQNLYQMVKGMSTAQATCRKGGVIIAVGECEDGIGGDAFARMLRSAPDMESLLASIRNTPASQTLTDQWQVQILARILTEQSVILISSLDDELVSRLHMTPAHTPEEALALAHAKLGSKAALTVIPEGISVIL